MLYVEFCLPKIYNYNNNTVYVAITFGGSKSGNYQWLIRKCRSETSNTDTSEAFFVKRFIQGL